MPNKPSAICLFLLVTFSAVNAVLFTPALPEIANYFIISISKAQFTITLFLIGYAFGQLIYGPLAKRYGCKTAIYIGILLTLLGAGLCILAASSNRFYLLIIGRLIMALGSSVGLMISFTIVSLSFSAQESRKVVSNLLAGFGIAPGVGVAIGGFLVDHFNWQSCFYFLAIYSLLLAFLTSRLPKINEALSANALQIKQIALNYLVQIKNKKLCFGSLVMGLCTAFNYIFAALAPFIAIKTLGLRPSYYGLFNLFPCLGILLASQLSAFLAKRWPVTRTIFWGFIINLLGALLMLASFNIHLSVLGLFIPMCIVLIGNGLMYINISSFITSSAEDKSNASAMMSFLNMGVGTLAVLSLGLFDQTSMLLPSIFVVLMIIIAMLLLILRSYLKASA
jgi:MFS family permease